MSRQPNIAPEISELVEQPVSLDEFERRITAPVSREEVEHVSELWTWFTRRYPTARDRMRYVRTAFRTWTRSARKKSRQA